MQKNQPLISALMLSRRQALTILGASLYFAFPAYAQNAPQDAHRLDLQPRPLDLPSMPIPDAQDQPVQFASLHGQALLVNFWATWCAPCVTELAHLEQAARLLGPHNIKILLVGMDRDAAVGKKFLKDLQIRTPFMAYDEAALWYRHFGFRGLPITLLITADQTRIASHTGPAAWHQPAIIDQITAFLTPAP